MQWEIWLVPLIAMAVWILGSLLRGNVEDRQRNNNGPQRPNPREPGPQEGRPRKPATDLEKFLEEVHRRRQATEKGEDEPSQEPPRPIPVVEKPVSRPQPRIVPAPLRQPPQPKRTQRTAAPTVRRTRPRQSMEEPVVLDVVVVQEPQPPLVQPVAPPSVIPSGDVVVMSAALRTPPTTPRSSTPRVTPSLAALLSSRQNLRNAFILKEIFDPPLSRRKK